MSPQFDLDRFLASPSLRLVDNCRKDDLVKIATHFGLSFPQQILKKELKALVVSKLVELKLIEWPVQTEPAGVEDAILGGEAGCLPPNGTPPRNAEVEGGLFSSDELETVKPPATLPRYEPLSPFLSSPASKEEARLKVRLARLKLESQEKIRARQAEMQMQQQLEIKKMEIEAETAIQMRRLELESQRLAQGFGKSAGSVSKPSSSTTHPQGAFDVGKNIVLVPTFRETEVDSYFSAFERIATALQWPTEAWALLLQCKLHGKAQEAIAALPVDESLQYESVKAAILRAYELVPEAYRQKFRNHKKAPTQSYVEYAREKGMLFDKWSTACKAFDFESLRELILIEDFKKCLPERIVVYINEQKVSKLSSAAVLADEFVLTHKMVFSLSAEEKPRLPLARPNPPSTVSPKKEDRECFYCRKPGHLISHCLALKRKEKSFSGVPKSVALIKAEANKGTARESVTSDISFEPFTFDGVVSLSGEPDEQRPVRILRDTGGSQSLILADALSFSELSSCGFSVVLRGIEMGYIPYPVHRIHIQSKLVTGFFPVAVCPALPVKGITLLMGNDIAGGKVTPALEVLDAPQCLEPARLSQVSFPLCVVTRAQARKADVASDLVSLSDSFLMPTFSEQVELGQERDSPADFSGHVPEQECPVSAETYPLSNLSLPVSRIRLSAAQKTDPTLQKCFLSVVSPDKASDERVCYLINDGVLMRRWSPAPSDCDWNVVFQVVVPSIYRSHVLSLAHDSQWSGHLGVTKTYQHILKHFYWPGLRSDVTVHCRSCHVCQIAGKPNQVIPPAPLHPIPAIGEPFERIIIDCVGPLPKTKGGNQYLLTIMCTATRFPEAFPLRNITARSITKALTRFFTTFGLPRVIQTDQGTNFKSSLFKQVLSLLNVQHVVSSPYHPQSQGALERWHQTVKCMLRKYCIQTAKHWDEGIPFLVFAAREAVQESLGFSPAALVFGHTPRGPLKSLQERFLAPAQPAPVNVLDFVSKFRERLHRAHSLAREALSSSQSLMKCRFDNSAVRRQFEAGDKVLVLLPIPGSALSAKFSGPYEIAERLSDTDYVIRTPERKRHTRVCHVNMLKRYTSRQSQKDSQQLPKLTLPSEPLHSCALIVAEPPEDLNVRSSLPLSARLTNSEMLKVLPDHLSHLSPEQRSDIINLINRFSCLFQDVPSRTPVAQHDIDVNNARPIKQHAYRVNAMKRELMQKEAEYLLEHGLAVHSSSPWSSPCLLEMKPDGSPRFITDYRKVNAVTVPDSYPLPRMEDCVDNLGTAKFVSKLDLLKGYWQVPLTERAALISAFVTPDYFLQYTVMPFGMCNAPATFQRLVNSVLSGLPNCNAYLDDLIVYSTTWEAHLEGLEQVFTRLANASLTVNLAKCEFGHATVTYLGKQVGQGQVRPVEAKVAAILDFPVPSTRKALRRFLGMAGYYRNFCRNFSTVIRPLTNLLSPKVNFTWSPECQKAFESAKSLLSHSPVLAAPDLSRPFKLEIDASAVGAGAVLLQENAKGVDHPVSYFSRKFNKYQVRYSTIEQETLALLWALQHFEVYLGSTSLPVLVFTDHNPLTFLSRMYNHNQRLMRWALVVQGYNLKIKHKKGSENVTADALSRV